MESHANKASNNILIKEENCSGFDVDDNLLSSIETKKHGINNTWSSVKSEPVEVCAKKSQPKSCVSSPESKHTRSVKRAKKDHVQSKAMESVDTVNDQPSLAGDQKAVKDIVTSNNLPPKADDVETNTTNNEKPNSERNGAFSASMENIQSFGYMAISLRYVFKYLKTHELLSASRVCKAWNIIAMDRYFWRTVHLKNSMVCNWNKCISAIDDHGSVSLDMRCMLVPTKIEDFDKFWSDFTIAIKKALPLKCLNLYKCPASVVEETVYSLPQLTSFKATSIKNPSISKERTNPNEYMPLNLRYLDQMTSLTEIWIKGLTGLKLTNLPSFESLINLKSLSLTSIKAFPKDICRTLETLSTSLEFFEIGDCDCLSEDFAGVIKRLKELKMLRLENCYGSFENFSKKVLSSIRALDKLKILELINIEFSYDVEDELEKCTNIKGLLIIPLYSSYSASTNFQLVECLKKLKKTLTHLVWGLTLELLRVTDLFISQQNQNIIGDNLESSDVKEAYNNIPILRTRKPRPGPGELSVTDGAKYYKDNVDILSVASLEKLLETLMINGKTKLVKIPYATTTGVKLLEHFNDL